MVRIDRCVPVKIVSDENHSMCYNCKICQDAHMQKRQHKKNTCMCQLHMQTIYTHGIRRRGSTGIRAAASTRSMCGWFVVIVVVGIDRVLVIGDFQIAIVFVKMLSLGICSTGNARARRGWHCIGVRGRGTRRGSGWLGRSGCGGISGGRLGFFTTAGKEGSESFLSFR